MKEDDVTDVVSYETARAISFFISEYREHLPMPRYDWAYYYDLKTETASLEYYGGRVRNSGYDAYYLWDIVGWIQTTLSIHYWFEYIPKITDDGYLVNNKVICHILPFINKPLYNHFVKNGLTEFEVNAYSDVEVLHDLAIRKIMDAYTEQLKEEYDKYDDAVEQYERFQDIIKTSLK